MRLDQQQESASTQSPRLEMFKGLGGEDVCEK